MRFLTLFLSLMLCLSSPSTFADEVKKKEKIVPVPPTDTNPPPVVPAPPEKKIEKKDFKDFVKVTKVFKGKVETSTCLYTFEDRCFTNLQGLEKYLIANVKKQFPEMGLERKAMKATNEKEETVELIHFDNKLFMTEEDYLLYLIQILQKNPDTAAVTPPPKMVFPKEIPDELVLDKRPADRDVGTIESPKRTFISLGHYLGIGPKGPEKLTEFHSDAELKKDVTLVRKFEEFQQMHGYPAVRVCFNLKDLPSLVSARASAMIKLNTTNKTSVDAYILGNYLPMSMDGELVRNSLKLEGEKICYQFQRGIYVVTKEEFKNASDYYSAGFKDYKGILALPLEVQTKLAALWKGAKTPAEKIEAIENFWIKEVTYLLDDHALYNDYFKKNPEHNLLQAAVALKKGRCLPKNFGLAVAIFQLSEGKLPVRISKGFSISRQDEKDKEPIRKINTKNLHLGVEVLIPQADGSGIWKVAEASVSVDDIKEKEAEAKLASDIREIVKKEMGDRKNLTFTLDSEQLMEVSEHVSATAGRDAKKIQGSSILTKVELEKKAIPEKQSGPISITEENDELVIKGVVEAVFPRTNLIDLQAGRPEHLAAFMGVSEYANEMGFGRTWKHIGGRRYQDTRLLKVYLPDGGSVDIQQTFIFDFALPYVVASVEQSYNGKVVYRCTGRK